MMRLDRSHGSRRIKSRVLTQSFSFLPLLEPVDGGGSKGPGLESWLGHMLPTWGGTLSALPGLRLVESAVAPPFILESSRFWGIMYRVTLCLCDLEKVTCFL